MSFLGRGKERDSTSLSLHVIWLHNSFTCSSPNHVSWILLISIPAQLKVWNEPWGRFHWLVSRLAQRREEGVWCSLVRLHESFCLRTPRLVSWRWWSRQALWRDQVTDRSVQYLSNFYFQYQNFALNIIYLFLKVTCSTLVSTQSYKLYFQVNHFIVVWGDQINFLVSIYPLVLFNICGKLN